MSSPIPASRSLLLALLITCWPANAASGEGELLFGMSTATTGPAAELGKNMRDGVLAAFNEANLNGGVHGREVKLAVLDDGYEPALTAPNMRMLIDQQRVLGIIGNVGTPTAVVAAPVAIEKKTLFFGAYTGAGVLRKTPPDRCVINYRASYAEETSAMVEALIEHLGVAPNEFGFFTQRDAYGDAGYFGGVETLRRHGLAEENAVTHSRYDRNTVDVETAVADLLMAEPPVRAVIMVGAYQPCAAFIRLAKDAGLDPLFLNVSFVGANPLMRSLGPVGDGVIITQVVPHYGAELSAVDEYLRAINALDKSIEPSFGSLEGYLAARILLRALAGIDGPIDRESVVDSLVALGRFDLGIGEELCLTPNDHQACHRVWPTEIRSGEVRPLEWATLRDREVRE
ncbi:Receptor family ligand binding region [Posidoniimonas polymericola]|uniref:Receptor family ligand binding region n=1 Tax=Posidoniimonas polymericola TaxID=2528002 RepID=A0A5C5YQU2_9BACT|nr:ABC transporter substrate-binding protein [Posidoniimonas polymericola]TWT77285.1 Receptor family ligand binding region [Posidoniimonas polymericola]